jgi:hypothetical protein
VDQRDQRRDVAVAEGLKGGAHRFNSHAIKIPPRGSRDTAFPAPSSSLRSAASS